METQEKKAENVKKDVSAQVLAKIDAFKNSGELRLPKDYSPENALKAAYLLLVDHEDRPLEVCTKDSIANALLKMVVYGLSPLKKQCAFIVYKSNKGTPNEVARLECSIEYAGNVTLAKRYGGLKSIYANAIFAGDTFEFCIDPSTGLKKILKHEQTLDSIGGKDIKGAYAIVTLNDGTTNVEVMNISQIHASWNMGAAKGDSKAHRNFPDQMAIKTVVNRACKMLIRSSDDSVLFYDDENSEQNPIAKEIAENANIETIEFQEIDEKDDSNTPIIPNKLVEAIRADSRKVENSNSNRINQDNPPF
jgi:recombination protein RecT